MIADLAPRNVERQWLQDPGFESWASPSVPNYWTASGVLSVAQESTEKLSGAFSCKATRSDGVTFSSLVSSFFNLPFGSWFYVGASAKGTVAAVNAIRLRFFNGRTGLSWDAATASWISGGSIYRDSRLDGYVLADGWVPLFPQAALPTDTYRLELAGYWPTGESMFYDEAAVFGPFARPVHRVGLSGLTYAGEGFRTGAFHL